MDEQIIITIVYTPATRTPAVILGTTGGGSQVNPKDVLLALHSTLGLYLEGIQGEPSGEAET